MTRPTLFWLILGALLSAEEAQSQLSSLGLAAFNPLSGQGSPPLGFEARSFPVSVTLSVRRILEINEAEKSFGVYLTMTLAWSDDRTFDLTVREYDDCAFYCSSQPSEVLNVDGQPACCDGVYVPAADAQNSILFPGQTVPYQYALLPEPDGTVIYTTSFSGTYSYHFNYASYPWDRHYLTINVVAAYMPVISSGFGGANFLYVDGTVITSQKTGPAFEAGSERQRSPILSVPGWQIGQAWMEVMNQSRMVAEQPISKNTKTVHLLSTLPGFNLYIEVIRVSRVFYATVVILPTALIVIFSFILFSLGRNQFKARINILLLLFLSLIILQYVLSSILPETYNLLSPVFLILVSYIYNFLLLFTSIISYSIFMQHTRRRKTRSRSKNRHSFQHWITAVRRSVLPSRRVVPLAEDPEVAEDVCGAEAGATKGMGSGVPASKAMLPGTAGGLVMRKPAKAAPAALTHHGSDTEEEDAAQPVTEIDERTRQWFQRVQKRRLVRWVPFMREFLIWHKFTGQSNSKNYLEGFSHRFEFWTRTTLFVLYLGAMGLIFGIAKLRVDEAANSYVVKPADALL